MFDFGCDFISTIGLGLKTKVASSESISIIISILYRTNLILKTDTFPEQMLSLLRFNFLLQQIIRNDSKSV